MNTGISYLYRDAGNYRKHNEVVVPGTFTPGQTGAITGCTDAGGYFIPARADLPEKRFGSITEDGHCWFEPDMDGSEETDAGADTGMTPGEVVAKFLKAKGNRDDSKEFGCEAE